MSVELAYVTALPRSARAADEVHVSAFVAPRLTPDAGARSPVLGDFALFREWASIAGSPRLSVRVHDQNGPMDCSVVSARPDAALWTTVFPRDLAVAANTVPDWGGRAEGSFSVPLVSAVSKTLQWMTAAASPGDTPLPSAHPLAPVFERLVERFQRRERRDRRVDARRFDEAAYLAMLDEASQDRRFRGLGAGLRAGATSFAAAAGAPSDVTAFAGVAILGLHQARRFYDRPEANTVTSGSPQHSDSPPKHLDPPRAEFHRRVSAAGDHPELLRRLGLLLDIEADPDRLATSAWIAVELLVDGTTQSTRAVRTAVRAMPDGTLVAAAAADGRAVADASDGIVLLGDPERFTVADVDPDGSALKMDRYLGNFPRMMALERNGDDVTAATPALRTQGLVVARQDRSGRARTAVEVQKQLEGALQASVPVAQAPLVSADAITRGTRIEVWDDHVRRWHSLHERLSTLRIDGVPGVVYEDLPNEGALQGTPAAETPGAPATAPVYVHETVFGWDGWSLSAPRPGKRLVPRDEEDDDTPTGWRQHEEPVDPSEQPLPGETPPDPFRFTHRIAPGTLPRLRFGRSYAFRAWTVDLGGHSRPHELNPPAPSARAIARLAADGELSVVLDRQRLLSTLSVDDDVATGVLDAAKASISAARERLRALPSDARTIDLAAAQGMASRDESAEAESALRHRLTEVAGHVARRRGVDEARLPRIGPRGAEEERPPTVAAWPFAAAGMDAAPEIGTTLGGAALWRTVESAEHLPVLSTASRDLTAIAALVASHAAAVPGAPAPATALQSVTPLTPFLRWDPVPPPVVVPRTRFTEGESLRTVVIRSKVVFAPDSDVPEITAPADFADELATAAGLPDAPAAGYREFGERHLVPPKATHDHAELHSQFDRALDAEGPEKDRARKDVLAWSRLESGTLFDRDILDVTDPEGPRIAQDARLLADPAAKGPLKTLPFDRPGEGPASGQYLAIDQEALTLPYLPDPLADGVSLRFTDAAPQRLLLKGRPSEGFTARYPGGWPTRTPWLLRVGTGTALSTELDGSVLGIALPPGESLKLRLSSSIVRDKLDELGPWRLLSTEGDIPLLREEAVDGRLWACSPSEAVMLVHATTRPVERPRLVGEARVLRAPGATDASLLAALDLHGPSTDSLTAELAWTDHVDDLGYDAPQERPRAQIGFTTPVAPFEDTALLGAGDQPLYVPELGLIAQHSTRHVFDDTKHHEVTYRVRATTRYREYFPPAALASDGSPGDDGRSVLGAPFTLHVPSSARPPKPVVHSVLPLLRWERGEEPHQPAAWRHTRLSGVRVYLERPWDESGDGELLGVLLAPAGTSDTGVDGDPYYSQWGADPIWPTGGVATRMLSALQLDSLIHAFGLDARARAGRPVTAVVELPPQDAGTFAAASRRAPYQAAAVVGYRPQYSAERKLWYVDIAFDLSTEFWPFVRLSLARYQPHSLPGFELSEAVRADFVQLTPPRETSVSRTDERHVRVLTSGPQSFRTADAERGGAPAADAASAPWMSGGVSPSALPALAGRLLVARLQRRDPDIGGDLGWTTVHTQEMVPLGLSLVPSGPTWGAELDAGEDVDLRTPRDEPSPWRVTVEEWERFPGDPPPDSTARFPQPPVWEQRLVYADEFAL